MKPQKIMLHFIFLFAIFLCTQFSFAAVSKKKFSVENFEVESKAEPSQIVDSTSNQEPIQDESHFCLTANFANLQKDLRENIAQKITAMKEGERSTIWAFLLICFIYGMLHALGPGHGKSIVVGYFLARKGRWRDGVFLGAGITFAHTLSAVLLLFVLYGILKTAVFPSFEIGRQGIEKASYGLVSFTGILLIGIAVHDLISILKKRKNSSDESLNCENANKVKSKNASWKELVGVAAITGIVPCPAVALIVLFCLLNSMILLALIAAAVICIGMTVTNVLFGVVAVAMKKGIDRGANKSRLAGYIHVAASFVGGLIVFLAGLFMISNL